MDHAMTTTAFTIDGFRVTKNLGLVRGIVVRSRSIVGSFGAFLQTIVGGNITIYTQLCEKTRAQAYDVMMAHAAELGANAVVGVRYDATEVMSGVTEVLCYGTAVKVEPVQAWWVPLRFGTPCSSDHRNPIGNLCRSTEEHSSRAACSSSPSPLMSADLSSKRRLLSVF
jgi:uncharacterized protein YbjQ (UPF0145 family)